MQKKKIFKFSEGITLIALIITIIVLLILAGVTINLTIGENGILKTAQIAARNYTNAQEKEQADLATFNNTLNDTINGLGKNEEKIIIAYDANGGTGEPQKQEKEKQIDLKISITEPSREGYIFKGWALSSNGEVEYQPGDYYTEDKSITLYAKWKQVLYLYNKGNKYESITGGWAGKVGNTSYGNVTDKGTSLYAYCKFNGNYHARWYTVNPVPLSGYKKVIFKGKFITPSGTDGVEYSTGGKIMWTVTDLSPVNNNYSGSKLEVAIVANNYNGNRYVWQYGTSGCKYMIIDGGEYEYMEIPIEDINEERYIVIDCQIGSSFELEECYLE